MKIRVSSFGSGRARSIEAEQTDIYSIWTILWDEKERMVSTSHWLEMATRDGSKCSIHWPDHRSTECTPPCESVEMVLEDSRKWRLDSNEDKLNSFQTLLLMMIDLVFCFDCILLQLLVQEKCFLFSSSKKEKEWDGKNQKVIQLFFFPPHFALSCDTIVVTNPLLLSWALVVSSNLVGEPQTKMSSRWGSPLQPRH